MRGRMSGPIANILKDNRQVGGLFDWDLQLVRTKGSDGTNTTEKVINRIINARKFWYYDDVEMPVTVRFYKMEDGTLHMVHREQCEIGFWGDKDVVVNSPINLEIWVEAKTSGLN